MALSLISHSGYTQPFVTGILEIPIMKDVVFPLQSLLICLNLVAACSKAVRLTYCTVQFCLLWTT